MRLLPSRKKTAAVINRKKAVLAAAVPNPEAPAGKNSWSPQVSSYHLSVKRWRRLEACATIILSAEDYSETIIAGRIIAKPHA